MTDMREALRDSLLTFWAAGASAARQHKEVPQRVFEDEAQRLDALMQPEIDRRVAEERAKLLERFDEDALEEIISDSLEMDWRPRDAARAIIAQFEKENSHEQG